ncbi:hypothetical protein KI387_009636, partial [Taxus chinensis]
MQGRSRTQDGSRDETRTKTGCRFGGGSVSMADGRRGSKLGSGDLGVRVAPMNGKENASECLNAYNGG